VTAKRLRITIRWLSISGTLRNVRLKRLVADLSLEKQVLKDVASGNL
jgi:hypothetical protein